MFWTIKYKTRAKNMKCKQAWKRQPVCSAYKALSSVMCNIFGSVCTLHCFLSKMSFLDCTLISKDCKVSCSEERYLWEVESSSKLNAIRFWLLFDRLSLLVADWENKMPQKHLTNRATSLLGLILWTPHKLMKGKNVIVLCVNKSVRVHSVNI